LRVAVARDQEDARGVFVEPVHKARPFRAVEAQPIEQRVDMPIGIGAALDGEPRRLIDHNSPVVAIQHRVAQ
jgi:hypothetical protein